MSTLLLTCIQIWSKIICRFFFSEYRTSRYSRFQHPGNKPSTCDALFLTYLSFDYLSVKHISVYQNVLQIYYEGNLKQKKKKKALQEHDVSVKLKFVLVGKISRRFVLK